MLLLWLLLLFFSNITTLFDPQVSQDLPFLHPSETSVLNRLSKLGSDYIRFTEFIEQHTGHVHPQVSESYLAWKHFNSKMNI